MFGATKPVLVKTFQSNVLQRNGGFCLGVRPVLFVINFGIRFGLQLLVQKT